MQRQDKHSERQGWRKANFTTESRGNFYLPVRNVAGKGIFSISFLAGLTF